MSPHPHPYPDAVGVVPAAGYAHRLGSPSISKEVLPVPLPRSVVDPPSTSQPRPADPGNEQLVTRPVCAWLLATMRVAGVRRVHMIVRADKRDIPEILGDGSAFGLELRYLAVTGSPGPPHSVDVAYEYVKSVSVAFGFPDVLFRPSDAFTTLFRCLHRAQLDVVLGTFPTGPVQLASGKVGMDRVHSDATGQVVQLELRPSARKPYLTWCLAVWTPRFTRFLHENLSERPNPSTAEEPIMGDALAAALHAGLRIGAVQVSDRPVIDVGTREGLTRARQGKPLT